MDERVPGEAAAATDRPADVLEKYEEIVARLARIVERLESGGLSLEESFQAFEQGVGLARAGAARLDEAERRVEVLLDGERTAPLDGTREVAAPRGGRGPRRPGEEDLS